MTHHPQHLDTRPRRRRAAMAVAGVASLAALFAATPSSIAAGPSEASLKDLVATADDGNSVGRCSFRVTQTDFDTNSIRAKVKNSARPRTVVQANDNASVRVRCTVHNSANGAFLGVFDRSVDSAYMTAQGITMTLPLVVDYTLCATVFTETKDGDLTTASECAN